MSNTRDGTADTGQLSLPGGEGRGASPEASRRERLLLVMGILTFFLGGYFLIGLSTDPQDAHSLRTWVDDRIPFIAESVFAYGWVYIMMIFPVFVVRCPRLFRRVALAYAIVIVAALICFALFPVTSTGLRQDIGGLDASRFSGWGLKALYALDPPTNLFPSLHLAIATLAALSAHKARASYGGLPFVAVAVVAVSICTVKQHFWIDGVAGLALAWAAYALVVRPYKTTALSTKDPAHSWRGPVAYLAVAISVYLGLYGGFRTGLEPWEWR